MDWSGYVVALGEKCKKAGKPFSATFELTPFCNFRCKMCYIRLTPEQAKIQGKLLTTDQWISIAKEAKRLGALGLEMTGGEAVIRSDFALLYEAFVKMGYLITLRSNGYFLRGEILELLKRYKPRCLSITLYGGSDETYKRVCGIDNGFSIITDNILALRAAGINLRLTATLTKENESDKVKLRDWAMKNNFFIAFFGGLITPIRAAKRPIDHLRVEYGFEKKYESNSVLNRVIEDREKYLNPFWMCRQFGTRFCISWDGRMTLCNCLPSIWTDVLSKGVQDAFTSLYEELNVVRRPSECEQCQYIDYCGSCPARLLSETGNHEKTCDSLCKIARVNYNISKNNETQGKDLEIKIRERNGLNED